MLLAAVVMVAVTGTRMAAMQLYPIRYREVLFASAAERGLDPYLVAAVIRVESHWRPEAHSAKGALGLMQIMPETGSWAAEQMGLGPVDAAALQDPVTNIRIGVWYLDYLVRMFEGDEVLALAAYNSGHHNVRKWLDQERWTGEAHRLDQIPFPETRHYVAKVLRDQAWYLRIYGGGRG